MCIVCLEPYTEGEKIRVLPCHHRCPAPALCCMSKQLILQHEVRAGRRLPCRFHVQCIDQWLSNRRLCPMCKHDASKPAPGTSPAPAPPAAASSAFRSASGPGVSLNQLAVTLAGIRRVLRTQRCGLACRLPDMPLRCIWAAWPMFSAGHTSRQLSRLQPLQQQAPPLLALQPGPLPGEPPSCAIGAGCCVARSSLPAH
jgi:hypothetical protein